MKTLLSIVLLFSTYVFNNNQTAMNSADKKIKVIYVYDALCGWCYGFSPVIQRFYEENKNLYTFEVISGGLIVGDRIGPYGEFANYILNAIPGLESTTGVKVGQPYLNQLKEDKLVQNSIPPAIALSIVKATKPEAAFAFSAALQNAKFQLGKDLNLVTSYIEILNELNIDLPDFKSRFEHDNAIQLAQLEFEAASKFGINGFPAVVVIKGDSKLVISRGYSSFQNLEQAFKNALH